MGEVDNPGKPSTEICVFINSISQHFSSAHYSLGTVLGVRVA